MQSMGAKVVPIQLYEALFLFLLFGFLCVRLLSAQSCGLPIYMALYGVWRFIIEFYRRDSRGSTVVDFLSPSQFIAVLMIIGAVGLYFGQMAIMKRLRAAEGAADAETAEVENEQ
jgi:prolipoprotein diacylglyceryltransferase